jgi:hypothetical protein
MKTQNIDQLRASQHVLARRKFQRKISKEISSIDFYDFCSDEKALFDPETLEIVFSVLTFQEWENNNSIEDFVLSNEKIYGSYNGLKVTIYRKSEFFGDVEKIEAKLFSVEIKKYAQYDNAIKYVFTRKGKRKEESDFLRGKDCFLKIALGWGLISPADTMEDHTQDLKKTKYLSFDPRYVSDFVKLFNGFQLENNKIEVLYDFVNYNAENGKEKIS